MPIRLECEYGINFGSNKKEFTMIFKTCITTVLNILEKWIARFNAAKYVYLRSRYLHKQIAHNGLHRSQIKEHAMKEYAYHYCSIVKSSNYFSLFKNTPFEFKCPLCNISLDHHSSVSQTEDTQVILTPRDKY